MVATINAPGQAVEMDPQRISAPWRKNLKLFRWFGSTMPRSRRNLADLDLAPAALFGAAAAVPNDWSVAGLNASNYMRDAIPDAPYVTLALIARSSDTHAGASTRPGYGGWPFGEGAGASLTGGPTLTSAASAPTYSIGGTAVFTDGTTPARQSRTILQTLEQMQAWKLYFVLVGSQVGLGIFNQTDHTGQMHEIKLDRVLAATSVIRWGSVLGGVSGSCDLAMAAVWTGNTAEALLSAETRNAVQAFCNKRLQRLGGPTV